MRGDPIPNDDNVLRCARPNLVDGDDVDGGAFQKRVRDDEVEDGLYFIRPQQNRSPRTKFVQKHTS